jgi:hypothetical protein
MYLDHMESTNLFIVAHDALALAGSQLEVIHSTREIEGRLEFVSHLIARDFSPHMGLKHMNPCAAHLKGVSLDVGRPRAPSNTIPGFH